MRKIVTILIALVLIIASNSVFGAEGGEKGASDKAYEHASEEAIFHRIGDWFSTIGKSEEEKAAIIAERKAKRATLRAQKEAEKLQRKLQKGMKKTQRKIGKQKGKAKKGF